jgi:hypothetical protein
MPEKRRGEEVTIKETPEERERRHEERRQRKKLEEAIG